MSIVVDRLGEDGLLRFSEIDRSEEVRAHDRGSSASRAAEGAPRTTDSNLVALASLEHPWIEDAYRVANGWIHYSAAHRVLAWKVNDEPILTGRVPVDVEQFDREFLPGLVDAMNRASLTLLDYLTGSAGRKKDLSSG